MVRTKIKWVLIVNILLIFTYTNSLPITQSPRLETTDSAYVKGDELQIQTYSEDDIINEQSTKEIEEEESVLNETLINTTNGLLRNIRPGQRIINYDIVITKNGRNFQGRAVLDVELTFATRDDDIVLNVQDLQINNVLLGVFTDVNAQPANWNDDDGLLEISFDTNALSYIVIVEYTIPEVAFGYGLYTGSYGDK